MKQVNSFITHSVRQKDFLLPLSIIIIIIIIIITE